MAYLFTVPARSTSTTDKRASTLKPKISYINVVENFPWTLTQSAPTAIKQTPYIELKEFQMKDAALNQMLKAYNKTIDTTSDLDAAFSAGGILLEPNSLLGETSNDLAYENLYDHTGNETGFRYKFPYFENPQNTTNNWTARSSYDQMIQLQRVLAEVSATVEYLNIYAGGAMTEESYLKGLEELLTKFPPTGQGVATLAAIIAAEAAERQGVTGEYLQRAKRIFIDVNVMAVDLQRTYEQLEIALKSATGNIGEDPVLDKPHIWSSSQPRVFNITFPLFNVNPFDDRNAEKTISYNWELCYLLAYQNQYNKINLFTGEPPVFYEVNVPGVYYTKAAYVSNLTILNVGNIRNMFLPVGNSGGSQSNYMSVNVPDAYVVNMTLVDFFMPSRNFLDTINNQGKRNRIKE